MKALVYGGPGAMEWTDVALPQLRDPRDAIVRVDAVTICGTDLHILKGDVPEVVNGRILGHEAVGTVLEVGAAVTGVAEGSRVLISCISGCGRCRFCRTGAYGQCLEGGGWVLGHLIDGTQAEYVRVPYADLSLHLIPETVSDQAALMLADIVPTAYEVGVLNGRVSPADTVAVVGAGPIGLAAIKTAQLFSPGRVIADRSGRVAARGRQALRRRHHHPGLVRPGRGGRRAHRRARCRCGDRGGGRTGTFELCTRLVRAGGHVANVGVHGKPVSLHLEDLWIKNVTITTGLVDTYSTPTLMSMLATGQLDTAPFVTHHFPMEAMTEAYDIFSRASETAALKVVLTRS